jgi:glycosyltransferase involved in cell wall biosynthesis
MRTSLIITTYNWPAALDLTLASVARQAAMPDEVLVADDGSAPATAELVAGWAGRLPVPVRHLWQEDLGFRLARSRNRAIAAATGEYLVLVDGDMTLHPKFIADHRRAARPGAFVQGWRVYAGPQTGSHMLANRLLDCSPLAPDLRRRHRLLRLPPLAWLIHARAHRSPRKIQGCNQGYWREDLLRVNGFDERMTQWGGEDDELGARLFNAGVRRRDLRFAAVAVHLHHPARGGPGPNPNYRTLAETRREGRLRCEHGIDAHLARDQALVASPATCSSRPGLQPAACG